MTCSHWNVVTGELFSVRSSRRQRQKVEAFEERLFEEEGWVEVPFLESDDAFSLYREFVDELAPGKGRTELLRALESDKPFRALRQVLKRRPGLQRRWSKVATEEASLRCVVFCVGQGLEMSAAGFAEARETLEEMWSENDRQAGFVAATSLSIGSRGGGAG